MSEAYRVNRVPVTDKIRDKIIELITNEDDIATKKKHPAKWYRTETATELKLSENANPSLRSYEDLVNETRQYLKKQNPLDDPWSFGSLINYPIPQDKINEVWTLCENLQANGDPIKGVPIGIETCTLTLNPRSDGPIMEIAGIKSKWHLERKVKLKWLTIRQVRWYVILRSIHLEFKGKRDHLILDTLTNALAYARDEQECEMDGAPMVTIDMDQHILHKK